MFCNLGLVTCQNNMTANASQSCCFEQLVFEWLKHHKVGILMKKCNSQRLKKSKKFAFGNSQFTVQHSISLSGTNKYRRFSWQSCLQPRLQQTSDQSSAWRPQSRFQVWLRKKWERCVGSTDSNFHGQRKFSLEQQLCYLIMHVFWIWSKTRMTNAIFTIC